MTTIESQTARLEDATPTTEAATGDTAIDDDLRTCDQLANPSTLLMPALKSAMASQETRDRCMTILRNISEQLIAIAGRYPPTKNAATGKQMSNEMKRLCIAGIREQTSDADAAKALAEQMSPAISLAIKCAITAAECRTTLMQPAPAPQAVETLDDGIPLLDDGTIALREEEADKHLSPPSGVRLRTSAAPGGVTTESDPDSPVAAVARLESTVSQGNVSNDVLAALQGLDAEAVPAKRRTSRQATQPHRRTLFQRITFRNRKPKPTSGRGGKGQKR